FLMSQTPAANQPWQAIRAEIVLPDKIAVGKEVKAQVNAPNYDFGNSRVLWELAGEEPSLVANANLFSFVPRNKGKHWIEVEARLPDGRRVAAIKEFVVQ
ncbi:MAG: hypothetical protein ACK4UN_19960, partial [Limisphaerales bacterium]